MQYRENGDQFFDNFFIKKLLILYFLGKKEIKIDNFSKDMKKLDC